MNRNKMLQPLLLLYLLLFTISLVTTVEAQNKLNIYGYFSTRIEKVYSEPGLNDFGNTVKATAPAEWSNPFFNVMLQHSLNNRFRIFINLNGSGADNLSVRNFWGEYSATRYLNIRIGKTYRKFGLYNEVLDAVPTYYGIEPPELFDKDHLIVSRTTVLMVYGGFDTKSGTINYSLTTDDGEGGPIEKVVPVGWDLNYKFGRGDHTIGMSGYYSGGKTTSDVGVGDGSPRTGVLPWMAEDKFTVIGGYLESRVKNLTIQGAFWYSAHDAIRDPGNVVSMINAASPNASQLARYLIDPNGAVSEDNVSTNGDYKIKTWYFRTGYAFETDHGEIAPYFQWDWYSNPETIKKKTYGGDNEAGFADNGKFNKATIGIVFRPIPEVAIKLDGSTHIQKFNGKTESYPEVRFDVSYLFGQ